MMPVFERMDARLRLVTAWAILAAAILLVTIPVSISALALVQSWQTAANLRADVSGLSERIYDQYDEIERWYAAQGENEDSVREYSDPDLARQAFNAEMDLFSQALIDAGAHLLQMPSSQLMPLGDGMSELTAEIAFSGAFSDVLRAFIALEHSGIRLSGLTIEALPGEPAGRVRGYVQLRHPFLTVSADDA